MAKCSRDAFPSVRRWRDCALMRPWPDWQWQYSRAVRSRASIRGKIPPRCVPGRQSVAIFSSHASPRGLRRQDSRAMHPKTGWLWQDMRAMHPKSPANSRLGIHRAKILPGRGAFRCTGPSNHARRADLAIQRRRSALAPATPAPPTSAKPPAHPQPQRRRTARATRNHAAALMAAHHPQHSRCQRQPHRKRSHTPPPHDTEASGGREILRRPSPAAPKRSSGTNGTAAPHGAIWPQHPQRRWRHQTRCEP